MDLTRLSDRLRDRDNTVSSFERRGVVHRSFRRLHEDVARARAALERRCVRPGMRVGILAQNCYEYIAYDLALIELRAVSVAFTEEFAGWPTDDLFRKYRLSLLLVTGGDAARGSSGFPVACIDDERDGARARPADLHEPDPGFDRPFMVFSSGSSGGVKGLVMDRRGVEETIRVFVEAVGPRASDALLLFLPMSNFQQRMMYYAALWYGFNLVIADPPRLFHALGQLRPTMLIAPPALYETIESRVANLPGVRRWLINGLGAVLQRVPAGSLRTRVARAAFRQLHEVFGGRMRIMITGMAPIKRSTLTLFERLHLPVYETYGLIECGSVTLNVPGAHRPGSVGRLLPGVQVSFGDDGEIFVDRAHSMAAGYFECAPGEAEATFVAPGRIATGDIGRLDAEGYLHLLGRKKEIIVTSGGRKVHPEVVEASIDACPDVAKSTVFREPDAWSLTAVIVATSPGDAAAEQRIRGFIDRIAGRNGLDGIGRVVFADEPFSRDNHLLRPNLKLDRRRIAERFGSRTDAAREPRAS